MNVLVTGGLGFIGSNYINYAVKKFSTINFYNLDCLNYCSSLENIKVMNLPNYNFIKGNICDYNLIVKILKNNNITHIIHFAAQSHVDTSFTDSLRYTEDNVKGTHTLLEAVKNTNLDIIFLHFSTDEVYGESKLDENAKTELSLLSPTNPYAASKAAAEMYVNSYIHSFNLKGIITRCNNVYGNNQYHEKLIPKFIKLLKENKKCTIHGDGKALRTFIHVDDVSRAIEFILDKGQIGEIYNIGSDINNEMNVLNLTKLLIFKIKKDYDFEKYIEYVDDRPFNDQRYFITNDKIKNLGWKQEIDFEDGINLLI
jgi:dTDP-glucose 4,6-dehydratase